jgi:hypothetical protein
MSMATFDSTSVLSPARHARKNELRDLSARHEELSALRLAILLTAKWEAQETESQERREDLQAELDQLHLQYYGAIDEIAMTFGVSQAMATMQAVERNVRLPKEIMRRKIRVQCEEEVGEEEDSAAF